jgi:hypothetical protein
MNNGDSLLVQAKARLSLVVLMAQLGLGDCAKKSARCPFHEDSSASFSVYTGDDGEERWKCFAGCGQGDVIDFLAKHRGLSNSDACREFIRLADVAPVSSPQPAIDNGQFDWCACVTAVTPDYRRKLADWRGYSPEFVEWLQMQNQVGLFAGEHIAFPVHDDQGNVVGCHYRRGEDGSWRYYPTGTRTAPLVVGDLPTAKDILVFESQWDSLAVLDCLHHHIQPLANTAAVATRGGANGRLLGGLCARDALVYAFAQNDEAGMKWLAAVAANSGRTTFHVPTPSAFKDANDWTRAGASSEEIRRAMVEAKPVPVTSAHDVQFATHQHVSNLVTALPSEEETAHADAPQPFPVESLPPALASIALATASCERVPAALPAVCAIGVASAAIGAGLEIFSASDRLTRANLFLLADAQSGSGKSQVFRRIAEAILDYQHQLHETWREKTAPQVASEVGLLTREIKRLETRAAKTEDPDQRQRLLGELEYKVARRALLEQKNAPPCIICADVTSEKLAVLLAANGETLASFSPEGRQIVDIICGRYNATKSTDEAIYLSGFSGDFLRVDRLGREPITLRKPCLSVLWLLQPDAMARLFETDTLAESGFLPRFLVCRTQAAPKKLVEGESEGVSHTIIGRWTNLIVGLIASYHSAEKPYRIEPALGAKHLLNEFYNQVVDRRAGDLSDVGQFASRYGEQAWRVALTFHAALHGPEAHKHPLHLETAQSAITIVRWFIDQQLAILAPGRSPAAPKLEDLVLELMESNRRRKAQNTITAREVQQAHIVSTAEAARGLLEGMKAAGLLSSQEIRPAGGGWVRVVYRALKNPVPA